MRAGRVVEVGNIFKLDTCYAEAFGAYFLDGHGRRRPILMGSYGIGVGRLLASACLHRRGAPRRRRAHLAGVRRALPRPPPGRLGRWGVAAGLYGDLLSAGVEVLYDDRRESFGTKFKDADLIGAPSA